jgi:hypothetical protein
MPTTLKRNRWKAFLHFLPAFVVAFAVPLTLLIVGYQRGHLSRGWPWFLIGGGAAVIVWRLLFVWLRDRDELLDLWSECKFMFIHATTAWSVGGGLACIFTGGYFLFTSNNSLFERYEGAFGIYVSVIGATLAIHAFYRHTAPIMDMDVLLRRLIDDLKEAEKDQSRLWIVYPALNLGYYRNREQLRAELPDDNICKLFKKALQDCAQKLGSRAIAITFPKELYEPLFTSYDKMIRQGKKAVASKTDPNCVQDCVQEAMSCLSRFTGNEVEKFGRYCPVLPREFPQQMVIVGDTVYSIMSYGLPVYKPNSEKPDEPASGKFHGIFHAIEGEHRPVLLLAYRRVDATLAESVSEHLQRLVDDVRT